MEVKFTLEVTDDGCVLATFADPDDLWSPPAAEFAADTADKALAGLLGLLTFNDALADDVASEGGE